MTIAEFIEQLSEYPSNTLIGLYDEYNLEYKQIDIEYFSNDNILRFVIV